MSLILKNLYFINNGGNKMKRTLLDDLEKVCSLIPCSYYLLCRECKQYKLCKTLRNTIKSIKKFY